jgi:hypothetical protein
MGLVDRLERPPHVACIGGEVAEQCWIGAHAWQLIQNMGAVPGSFQTLRHVVPDPADAKPTMY